MKQEENKLIKDHRVNANKKKILVTGADGFIGSHLAQKLVLMGYNVKVLVLYNSFNSFGWIENLPKDITKKLEIVSGDVRDQAFIRSCMKDCEMVMHLAALIAIPYSYISTESYVQTNIQGTLNILLSAKEQGIERVLITSTSEFMDLLIMCQ